MWSKGDDHVASLIYIQVVQIVYQQADRLFRPLDHLIGYAQILLKPRRGDRGSGEFHANLVALDVFQVIGPSVVGITRQYHQVLVQRLGGAQNHFPLILIAIPGIQVVGRDRVDPRQFFLGQGRIALKRPQLELRQCREVFRQAFKLFVGNRHQQLGGQIHPAHQYLLAQHLPGGTGIAQGSLQPEQLLGAKQGSVLAADIGSKPGCIQFFTRKVIQVVQLLITADDTGIQHMQVHQVTKPEGTENGLVAALNHRADRQPFEIRLQGTEFALGKVSFPVIVILCPFLPGVVGDFVVIPDHDERHPGVQRLKVLIRPVNGIAPAVVLQFNQLQVVVIRKGSAQGVGIAGAVAAALGAVFVDVVTQMHHGIEITQFADLPVDVEVTSRVVGTGDYRKADRFNATFRKCPGHTNRGTAVSGLKTVVVDLPGRQSADIHLDGKVIGLCSVRRT